MGTRRCWARHWHGHTGRLHGRVAGNGRPARACRLFTPCWGEQTSNGLWSVQLGHDASDKVSWLLSVHFRPLYFGGFWLQSHSLGRTPRMSAHRAQVEIDHMMRSIRPCRPRTTFPSSIHHPGVNYRARVPCTAIHIFVILRIAWDVAKTLARRIQQDKKTRQHYSWQEQLVADNHGCRHARAVVPALPVNAPLAVTGCWDLRKSAALTLWKA